MAVYILFSKPEHSRVSLIGPSAAILIFSADCFGVDPRSISTVRTPGTSFFAKSRRLWNRSVITMGSAPAALAESKETKPIGPAPLKNDQGNTIAIDGSEVPNKSGVTKTKATTLDTSQRYSQGLAQGALLKRDRIRQTMKPFSRMEVPSCECPCQSVIMLTITSSSQHATHRGKVESRRKQRQGLRVLCVSIQECSGLDRDDCAYMRYTCRSCSSHTMA